MQERADPQAVDSKRSPALIVACELGHTQVAALLLRAGASLSARDCAKATALVHTCRGGHLACTKLLLRKAQELARAERKQGLPHLFRVRSFALAKWRRLSAAQWAVAGGHTACAQRVERAVRAGVGSTTVPSSRRWTPTNANETRLREPTKAMPASLSLSSLRPGVLSMWQNSRCRSDVTCKVRTTWAVRVS